MCRTKMYFGVLLIGVACGLLLGLLIQSVFWKIVLFLAALIGGFLLTQN